MKMLIVPLMLVLSACATFGLSTPQNLEQKIAYADKTVQSVAEATDQALLAHSITSAQAQHVSEIEHQIIPFLDAAKAAPGTAEANRNLQLALTLLNGLQAFIQSNGAKP